MLESKLSYNTHTNGGNLGNKNKYNNNNVLLRQPS